MSVTNAMTENESDKLRKAFGRFATGVTVITMSDEDDRPLGMTASSFNSVSLDPPMVLWSAGQQAGEYERFAKCAKYAVHVLSDQQAGLSNHFATPSKDKFEAIDWQMSAHGLPLIAECPMCLQCETISRHEAGDHMILVGTVIDAHINSDAPPLLYYSSAYHHLGDGIEQD